MGAVRSGSLERTCGNGVYPEHYEWKMLQAQIGEEGVGRIHEVRRLIGLA